MFPDVSNDLAASFFVVTEFISIGCFVYNFKVFEIVSDG
jgi:hypothetical protein